MSVSFKTTIRPSLFKFIDGQFTFLSKPFKTKRLAEKERLKYPKREQRMIGLGVVRTKS